MKTLNNQVHLIGNLGRDPELKEFDSGNAMCRFSLATNYFFKDKNGERQQRTDWHTVVAWGKLAEVMTKILEKGQKVAINGKLKTRKFEDGNGKTRYVTEVIANDFLKLSKKRQEEQEEAVEEEDLPF
jgi:single-strand DNA-binding protein